jgi:integrase
MLTLRQRGKNKIFSVRGTVTLGDKCITVSERSSGTSDKSAATFFKNQLENDLKNELMFGKKAQVAKATFAEAFAAYLSKPQAPNSSDVLRIGILNEYVGTRSLCDPLTAWKDFRLARISEHAPAGQDRYRSVFQAAINYYYGELGLAKIKIPTIKFTNERVRFLELAERDLLISCYTKHVQPIIIVFAYQGPRAQEALQLLWGINGVDLERNRIYFGRTKEGKPLTTPMHPKVEVALRELWEERGRPKTGHVFLNRVGKPYADTRDYKIQGGNPLKRAHATALKRAGILDFTVHDWRHHWASHCVMAGIDLESLRQLGGWASLKMVQRYAGVSADHLRNAIARLK